MNNALQNGKTQMAALAQVTENLSGMLNMLPNFLGANGARNYVLLAQTNSEIRGTGGLIGSAGSFSADNGKIAVGEFHADAEFPSNAALDDVNQDGDGTLYSGLYFGQVIHNLFVHAGLPARRVHGPEVLAGGSVRRIVRRRDVARPRRAAGDDRRHRRRDSVRRARAQRVEHRRIPAQRRYKELTPSAQDQYFSETAAQAVAHLFSDMNTQKLMTVAKTMLRMAEQRHLYFWSFHEEDQRCCAAPAHRRDHQRREEPGDRRLLQRDAGLEDGLVHPAQVDGEEDRRQHYHVTYSFTNTLQPGEAGSLPEYITANAKGGVAVNRVVIYTPAGGEVSNVSASNGSSFAQVQAKDHMTYMDDISLRLRTR
mgnify:CR=1 FL=1